MKFNHDTDSVVPVAHGIRQLPVTFNHVYFEYAMLVRSLCHQMDSLFTQYEVRPLLEKDLGLLRSDEQASAAVPQALQLYVCGLLTTIKPGTAQVMAAVRDFFVKIATTSGGWSVKDMAFLKGTIQGLMSLNKKYLDHLLQVFIDLTTHESTTVRQSLPMVATILITHCSHALLVKKVIAWANTLSNDTDRIVRVAAVSIYGAIIEVGGRDREVWEKLEMQLSALFDDPQFAVKLELLVVLTNRAGYIEEHARDTIVLPLLMRWATIDFRLKTPVDEIERVAKLQLCVAALSCIKSFSAGSIPDGVANQFVVPILILIKKELAVLAADDNVESSNALGRVRSTSVLNSDARLAVQALSENDPGEDVEPSLALIVSSLKDFGQDKTVFEEAVNNCNRLAYDLIAVWDKGRSGLRSPGAELANPMETADAAASARSAATKKESEATADGIAVRTSSLFPSARSTDTKNSPLRKVTASFLSSKLFQKIHERTASIASTASSLSAVVMSATERSPPAPAVSHQPVISEEAEKSPLVEPETVGDSLMATVGKNDSELTLSTPLPTIPASPMAVQTIKEELAEEVVVPITRPVLTTEESEESKEVLADLDQGSHAKHSKENSSSAEPTFLGKAFNTSLLSLSIQEPSPDAIVIAHDDVSTSVSPITTKPKNFFDFDEPLDNRKLSVSNDASDAASIDYIIDTIYPSKSASAPQDGENENTQQ